MELLNVRGLPFESLQKATSKWLKACIAYIWAIVNVYSTISTDAWSYQGMSQFVHSNGNDLVIIVYSVQSQGTEVDTTSHWSAGEGNR